MKLWLAVLATGIALGASSQVGNESNAAYRRFNSLERSATASPAEVLKAAEEWLQTYERNSPDPQSIPPYLILARFYAAKRIRSEETLSLLE